MLQQRLSNHFQVSDQNGSHSTIFERDSFENRTQRLFQRELCEHFLAYRYSKNDTEDSLH